MKRDIDLKWEIIFKNEEEYKARGDWIHGLQIDGYGFETVAEYCELLY